MIKLKLDEMLKTRGLTAYGLHVKSKGKGKKAKARLHQSVISKIKNNDSKALRLDILDVLCELLDCQPADLIVYESTTQDVPTTQTASDNKIGVLTFADAVRRLGKSESAVRRYLKAKDETKRLKGNLVNKSWKILEGDLSEFENSDFFKSL